MKLRTEDTNISAEQPKFRDLRDPVLLLACGFGSGLAPKAPGTFGTLAATALWLVSFAHTPWWAQGIVCVAAAVAGIRLCDLAVARLGQDDHQAIVWDEFAGVWLALFIAPVQWWTVLLAVISFRILDITKLSVVGMAERRWRGGAGVMADDLVAGALAGMVTLAIAWTANLVFQ